MIIGCLHHCSRISLSVARTAFGCSRCAAENLLAAVHLRTSTRGREPGPGHGPYDAVMRGRAAPRTTATRGLTGHRTRPATTVRLAAGRHGRCFSVSGTTAGAAGGETAGPHGGVMGSRGRIREAPGWARPARNGSWGTASVPLTSSRVTRWSPRSWVRSSRPYRSLSSRLRRSGSCSRRRFRSRHRRTAILSAARIRRAP
jgi:hypothetical protein